MVEQGILNEADRVELLNGEIFTRSPIGKKHAAIVNRLVHVLSQLLGNEAIVSVQNPILAGEQSMPEPDIAILHARADFYASQHPMGSDIYIVIEVADSSIEIDREIKLPIYVAAGIPEYWIIDLHNNQIEVYRTPSGDQYRIRELIGPDDILPLTGLDKEVEMSRLLP